ncbi:MAG: internal scaffolding protein [Microvirus sp.]|nr:MAG: internal scaffolding protein [Microvirus sp.]
MKNAVKPDIADDASSQLSMHDFFSPRDYVEPLVNWGPSLTRQEFADECDINVIMQTYERTGVLPPAAGQMPQYLDLTNIPADYQTALEMMAEAKSAFENLPAAVRREFNNDASAFVEFASDPENLSQMQTWGLAPLPPPPKLDEPAGVPGAPSPAKKEVPPGPT